MTDLKIDSSAMEAMVAKAIMDTLTNEQRAALIEGAIASLLTTPKSDRYGQERKSPLREMFESEARAVAQRYVFNELEKNEEFKAKIRGLFMSAIDKILEGEVGETLASNMADAFVRGMNLDRY